MQDTDVHTAVIVSAGEIDYGSCFLVNDDVARFGFNVDRHVCLKKRDGGWGVSEPYIPFTPFDLLRPISIAFIGIMRSNHESGTW